MEIVSNILSRIKWRNVFVVLILLGVVFFVVKFLPLNYKVKDNIGLKASVSPDRLNVGERAKVSVEIKNMYPSSDATVVLSASTYDKNLLFMETSTQNFQSGDIKVGPSETREVSFTVEARKEALAGNYRVDVKVAEKGSSAGAEDTLFLKVERA